jgi:hypothetical protein
VGVGQILRQEDGRATLFLFQLPSYVCLTTLLDFLTRPPEPDQLKLFP